MKVGRVGIGFATALLIAAGCGDDKASSPPAETPLDESWAALDPPSHVDIAVCAAILDDGAAIRVSECSECCNANDYQVSSFINQGHCTCAKAMLPDTTICAGQTVDSEQCIECCQAAEYIWPEYVAGGSPSCTCDMLNDKTRCKNTVTRTDPGDQCALCCLNHGFINAAHTAIGEPECACS